MRAATGTSKSAVSTTPDDQAQARMKALGQVIRAARGEMSQAELGAEMNVPQTTISRWEMGQVDLSMEQVRALEIALRVRPGTLAVSSGYAAPEFTARDIEMALRADPSLHQDLRNDVVRSYRSYVEASRKLIDADAIIASRPPSEPAQPTSRRRRSSN